MRITKFASIFLTVPLMVGLNACGDSSSGSDSDSEQSYSLKINSGLPATHPIVTNMWDPWLQEVEERTNGRVTGQVYNGEALGTLSTAIDDVQSGVYEVGMVVPSYFYDSAFFPMTIGSLAFAYPDAAVGSEMFDEFIDIHKDEMNIDGLETAGGFGTDPYVIFSKQPTSRIADLQNVSIKGQGESDAALLQAWGASPASLPTGEVYEALDKNTITAAAYTKVGIISTKFYEVAPYMTDTALWGSTFALVINRPFLDSLPDDLRGTFDAELTPRMTELALDVYQQEVEQAEEILPELLREHGGGVVEVSDEDERDFRSTGVEEQWTNWIALADDRGLDGQALVETWFDLMEQNGLELPY